MFGMGNKNNGGETRDQRLARTKYSGRVSASAERRARQAAATGTDNTMSAMEKGYDAVRGTKKSAERRAASRSVAGVSRWRRSVSDEWNR